VHCWRSIYAAAFSSRCNDRRVRPVPDSEHRFEAQSRCQSKTWSVLLQCTREGVIHLWHRWRWCVVANVERKPGSRRQKLGMVWHPHLEARMIIRPHGLTPYQLCQTNGSAFRIGSTRPVSLGLPGPTIFPHPILESPRHGLTKAELAFVRGALRLHQKVPYR